jgi:predicted DNA-binding transcriptional regulator AlpA
MIIDTDDLVSVADICAMAQVTSQAVSNWAARHADFPKPVIMMSNGKFKFWLRPEVEAWLTTPRTVTRVVAPKVQR